MFRSLIFRSRAVHLALAFAMSGLCCPESTWAAAGPTGVTTASAIEGAMINPYQTANVGAEVSGIIADFLVKEGDLVEKGQVVAKIADSQYATMARRAGNALAARRLELRGLAEEEGVKAKLVSLRAATRPALATAVSRREVAGARLKEANEDHALARLNLDACSIRAPFRGYVAVRYKQPHEPVERLEKVFAIVDTSKVHAVGNLPEERIHTVRPGMQATFVSIHGKRYEGTVERIATLLDPQSRTKRIHVVIDNPAGSLEVGMVGKLELAGF